jgi:hypothetical protein
MCHDFMGNSNYLQCFPVGVIKGEKVGQIDKIYVRGKFRRSTLGNSNWPVPCPGRTHNFIKDFEC